ncbi:MAG: hypothetical protein ACI8T1_001224 [Verrucomicrobiales bacterium]|jgi:hypothetical protein
MSAKPKMVSGDGFILCENYNKCIEHGFIGSIFKQL